jgi:hypothetical protein
MTLCSDHIEFTLQFHIQIEQNKEALKYIVSLQSLKIITIFQWNHWVFHDRVWYTLLLENGSDHQLVKFDLDAQKIIGLDFFIRLVFDRRPLIVLFIAKVSIKYGIRSWTEMLFSLADCIKKPSNMFIGEKLWCKFLRVGKWQQKLYL